MLSAGPISHGSLQWQIIILDLSLIDFIVDFFPSGCVILIQWFLWVLSEQSSFCLVMKCFPKVFWCYFLVRPSPKSKVKVKST